MAGSGSVQIILNDMYLLWFYWEIHLSRRLMSILIVSVLFLVVQKMLGDLLPSVKRIY